MNLLKRLPIKYKGELHHVRLVNFSVDKEEVTHLVPKGIRIRDYHGRALISLVNVELKQMHPTFLPDSIHFDYQHIGFRLLIDDSDYNRGDKKGIYFLRSFTDKPIMVWGGSIFTNYKLELAMIENTSNNFQLLQNNSYLSYSINDGIPAAGKEELFKTVQQLDRAYSFIGSKLVRVQIMREKWPIQWLNCSDFKTNFFTSAQFEGAFEVKEMIPYEWLPAQPALPWQ